MQSWQHLFTRDILSRGLDYYKSRKVENLTHEGDTYTATVRGSKNYDVKILIANNEVAEMDCSCPYAEDGRRCKHMAAALFKIDALQQATQEKDARATPSKPNRSSTSTYIQTGLILPDEQPKKPEKINKRIFPFTDNTDEYSYFSLAKLTEKLIIYEDTYKAAEKLYKSYTEDDVKAEILTGRFDDGPTAYFTLYVQGGYQYKGRLSFNGDIIKDVACYEPKCYCRGSYGMFELRGFEPCKHQLALMLYARDYLRKNNAVDATDYFGTQFLNEWRGRYFSTSGENGGNPGGKKLFLEPRISTESGGIKATFRIGCEHAAYVVRNLETLVTDVEYKNTFEAGNKLTVDFKTDYFDDRSERYFNLIRRYIIDREQREIPGAVRDIILAGSILDDFYEIANGNDIICADGSSKGATMKCDDRDLILNIKINAERDSRNVYHGASVRVRIPNVAQGANGIYFCDDSGLHRMTEECFNAIAPVIRITDYGFAEFKIGRLHMAEFYQDFLPSIRKYAKIEETGIKTIEEYLPPEPDMVFYMDAQDGLPFCRAEAVYGEERANLSDRFTGVKTGNVAVRNELREVNALNILYDYYPIFEPTDGTFRAKEEAGSVFHAVTDGVEALVSIGEVYSTAAFNALQGRKSVHVKIGVSLESDLLNLTVSSGDVDAQELLQILESYRQKKKYYRLKTGEFVDIDGSIADLAEMADALRLSPKELISGRAHIPLYRALYLDKMLEKNADIYSSRDKHFKTLISNIKSVDDAEFELSEEMASTLRSYQVYGYKWLRTLSKMGFGGILADDMGLGKTLQIISVLDAEKREGNKGTSLIVCPASLVYNWADEFARFAPQLRVCPVAGNKAEREAIISSREKYDALITSYDLLKRDIADYEGAKFLYEIIDEAQYIKNHSTAAAKAVKVISATHRFALTGTPIENRLSELWSIFDYCMPGFLYGYDTFRTELEYPITREGNEQASERLRKMVGPFILRRLKTDVLRDLPEKTEEIHSVRLGGEQQKLYDASVMRMLGTLRETNDEAFKHNKLAILAELMKIRQVCCDPKLLFEDYDGGSAKREACVELLRSAIEGEHRVLLFSQFTSMLDLLKPDLQRENFEYFEITGATPKKERLRLVNEFNNGTVPVFLISLKAGGTGLNLTGADIVIHYDPWWNAAAQNQATDRAHRIGQTKPVTVYKLIAKDSIEEKIVKMQQMKLALADEILSGETGSIGSLSREELIKLFE